MRKSLGVVLLALVFVSGLLVFGCADVQKLLPKPGGEQCTTTTINKTVCEKQKVQEPYTEKGSCVTKPYEAKECKDEPIKLSFSSVSVTGRWLVDAGYCNASASVVVSNPEAQPVDFKVDFTVDSGGKKTKLSDSKTIKPLSSESFGVRFIAPGWDCASQERRPTVDISYALPTKEICTTETRFGEVCENVTGTREVEKEVCEQKPVEVKTC